MNYGTQTQRQIFTNGMMGKKPPIPLHYTHLKSQAQAKLTAEQFAYIDGGAGQGRTIRANEKGFEKYPLKASMMKASSNINLEVSILGHKYASPILAAPIGVLEMAHPSADIGVAKACKTMKTPMIFSSQASFSMEKCAAVMDDSPRWFQLYWSKSDELVQSFLSRAESCKCDAIVVTLDTTRLGWRPRDLELGYLPFLRGLGLAHYYSDPVFQYLVNQNMNNDNLQDEGKNTISFSGLCNLIRLCNKYPGSFRSNLITGRALTAVRTFTNIYMRPELKWGDLIRLRKMTNLPIVVKGVQTLEDVHMAEQSGVDGVIVSNHGGRQIDGGVAAIHCLRSIAQEYSGHMSILFDSGIRSGADVIKALALGADAVLVGRPYVYALAIAGETGVETLFRHYLAELELQMSLMGISSIKEINSDVLY
ncbi:alpha-hydroxy-acid oxidizing protein [Membranihabitans marinus]|uniref:alpha-hydroxy-acid oxidizing protein n=1 Tax=Membranihabitans marinus TaxID=1227546 RepID=UPI001EFFE9B0|nr:alpha-hydroxy-acid oxidizing protein [Membranihabitans marinus]